MDLRSSVVYALGSFLALALVGSITQWLRARRVRSTTKAPDFWSTFAENLFLQHGEGPVSPDAKIRSMMSAALTKLELRHGYLFLHARDQSRILVVVSNGYVADTILIPGKVIARMRIYCGLLSGSRPMIAIDAASLSQWGRHAASRELGWESYIGAHISLEGGLSASLAFVDSRPRDRLYSGAEKEFVSGLARWCGKVLEIEAGATNHAENPLSSGEISWRA